MEKAKERAAMNLSYRLKTVASFVPRGSSLADIGTDHGYVPIYLAREGIIEKAIAMDVRKGPLDRAAEHIREYGLEDRIKTRLSDGLKELKEEEADTVVIAGMGGELIIRILTEGQHMWPFVERWILSPQSDLHKVRAFLRKEGFSVTEEAMIRDEGKYYTILTAGRRKERAVPDYEEKTIYDYYGKYLIETKNQVLEEYLEKEKQQKKEILQRLQAEKGEMTERTASRIESLRKELLWIKEAQDEMQ